MNILTKNSKLLFAMNIIYIITTQCFKVIFKLTRTGWFNLQLKIMLFCLINSTVTSVNVVPSVALAKKCVFFNTTPSFG